MRSSASLCQTVFEQERSSSCLRFLSLRLDRPADRYARLATSISPYPLPSRWYPLPVFDHPGILHRNSRTKSRAIASALVARLKRRDLSCIGGDLRPEYLGDRVSAPTPARDSARPSNGSSCTPQN